MILSNGLHQLIVEVDNDVYWGLIKLGAGFKMHPEIYAEHVLAAHIKHELDKQTSH